MDPYLTRPAFAVSGETFLRLDAQVAALAWGEWASHRDATIAGMALVEAQAPADDRVNAAARDFRYARDLVAGDDMRRWLDARGLTVNEWMDHVRRQVALGGNGRHPTPASPRRDAEGALATRAALVDAICLGLHDRVARELAGRAALAAESGVDAPAADVPDGDGGALDAPPDLALAGVSAAEGAEAVARVARVDRAYAYARARIVTPQALAAQVASHRLEWMTVECRVARFASEPAAREAAMCVRADGEPLAAVAADARALLEERWFLLDDAGPLQSALMGAAPGELVGPLVVDGAQALIEVIAKRLPALDDDATRRRAERAVLDMHIASAVAARVRWG